LSVATRSPVENNRSKVAFMQWQAVDHASLRYRADAKLTSFLSSLTGTGTASPGPATASLLTPVMDAKRVHTVSARVRPSAPPPTGSIAEHPISSPGLRLMDCSRPHRPPRRYRLPAFVVSEVPCQPRRIHLQCIAFEWIILRPPSDALSALSRWPALG
jgi:hypothetical protein